MLRKGRENWYQNKEEKKHLLCLCSCALMQMQNLKKGKNIYRNVHSRVQETCRGDGYPVQVSMNRRRRTSCIWLGTHLVSSSPQAACVLPWHRKLGITSTEPRRVPLIVDYGSWYGLTDHRQGTRRLGTWCSTCWTRLGRVIITCWDTHARDEFVPDFGI
jgi:hypothetical protein